MDISLKLELLSIKLKYELYGNRVSVAHSDKNEELICKMPHNDFVQCETKQKESQYKEEFKIDSKLCFMCCTLWIC